MGRVKEQINFYPQDQQQSDPYSEYGSRITEYFNNFGKIRERNRVFVPEIEVEQAPIYNNGEDL